MVEARNGVISDPEAARLLSDRARGRYLDPFLDREVTVAEAAEELGVSPQRMSYWVAKLERLGLIRHVRSELRGRSRTAVWSSVAPSFSFPLELLPTDDLETLELYFQPVWRSFLRAVAATGRHYSAGWQVQLLRQNEQPAFHIVPSSELPADIPLLNAWARLELSAEQALAFRVELEALLKRYMSEPVDDAPRSFLAHVAMVAVPEE